MHTIIVSRIITCWMVVILTIMLSYIFSNKEDYSGDTSFYRFGPNPELVIIGIVIRYPYKIWFSSIICCNQHNNQKSRS